MNNLKTLVAAGLIGTGAIIIGLIISSYFKRKALSNKRTSSPLDENIQYKGNIGKKDSKTSYMETGKGNSDTIPFHAQETNSSNAQALRLEDNLPTRITAVSDQEQVTKAKTIMPVNINPQPKAKVNPAISRSNSTNPAFVASKSLPLQSTSPITRRTIKALHNISGWAEAGDEDIEQRFYGTI
jgi:hypothetical protein